ncbi:MAG: HlyD family efflux transporter periplasmic adaptor subunit [Balneolales bacterium]
MAKNILLFISILIIGGCAGKEEASDAYGNFEATEVMVSAEAGGRLMSLEAGEGVRLTGGEVIGRVDTLALFLEIRQIEAQREAVLARLQELEAEANVLRQQKAVANLELGRIQRMYEDGSATLRQLDDTEGKVSVLERQITAAESKDISIHSEARVLEAQMERLRERIDRATVRNPVDGTVLARYAEPGEIVSPGQPLYKLADLETMYLRAYISGSQLANVETGKKVGVLFDGPNGTIEQIEGEISWIASRGEFTPRTIETREERVNTVYAIKVRVQNDGRLKIGMPGEVQFDQNVR